MNRDFLDLYNEELRHIREGAVEFAEAYPKVAKQLDLQKNAESTCPDPFVERLLEGFAFLTARVRLKLEAEYPRFTQGILDTVYPDYVAPWPSAGIVQFTPKWNDASLLKGTAIPPLTPLESKRLGDKSCTFRTAHRVELFPLQVLASEYHFADIRALDLNLREAPVAAFRIRLGLRGLESAKMSDLDCDRLTFFLHGKGDPRLPADLLENIFSSARDVIISAPRESRDARRTRLGPDCLRHVGFEDDEAMLPANARSFEGHRILREHFLMPQRNSFFEIRGLREAFRKIPGRELDIFITVDRLKQSYETIPPPEFVQLFCTPAINLFPVDADRTPVTRHTSEYRVIINRTRTLDHEVYGIESVNGYRRSSPEKHPFHPLYLRPVHEERLGGYYTVFREARQASAQSGQADWQSAQFNRQRSYTSKDAYVGSEVFLSIVDDTAQPMQPGVEQLQVRALCTNRHLPLDLEPTRPGQTGGPSDFTARDMARVESIRILVGLTPPRPSFAESGTAWRAVNHLSLNYLSLVTDPRPGHPSGAEALRSLLRLYAADPGSAATKVLIDGVRSITSGPSLARSPGGGPVSFIRGINIDLTLEDKSFSGIGLFPLASVLEQFFARHVSINHFTRLTLHTPERERIMEWPARVGRIPVC